MKTNPQVGRSEMNIGDNVMDKNCHHGTITKIFDHKIEITWDWGTVTYHGKSCVVLDEAFEGEPASYVLEF